MLNEPCQSANHRRSAVWDPPRLDPIADDRYSLILCTANSTEYVLLWSKSMSIFSSVDILSNPEYLYLYLYTSYIISDR